MWSDRPPTFFRPPISIFRTTPQIRAFHLWRPQKNRIFDPSLSPHEPDPPTPTCGRSHAHSFQFSRHEIHIALLKRLVQWPSGPKAEIRLYGCNLFKTVLLIILSLIYIAEKFPHFIPSKHEILVKKMPTSLQEKKTGWHQWSLNFNFLCGHPHGDWPPPSVHLSLTPPPPPPCGRHKWM